MLTALRTVPPALREPGKQPKIVALSANGVTRASFAGLPLPLRVVYPWLVAMPNRDKSGMERALAHVSGRAWDDPEPGADLMGDGWAAREGMPAPGALPDVVVVRPGMLTDGPFTGVYRVGGGGAGYYTIGRRDLAHFVVEGVLKGPWARWKGQGVPIAY